MKRSASKIVMGGGGFSFREIPDSKAEKEITRLILSKRSEGIKRVSALDFVADLRIPAPQVEKVMTWFEKDGRVKEIKR